MRKVELVVLMFVAKWMLRVCGVLVKAIGRRLPRNINPVTGKDRLTGSRLVEPLDADPTTGLVSRAEMLSVQEQGKAEDNHARSEDQPKVGV